MDPQINQSQIKLEELLKELVSLGNISEKKKQELFTKLEGAIVLNIVNKLFDQLSENDRKNIEQKELKTNEDLFKFLSNTIPQDGFHKIAEQSVGEVVKKFLEKI